MSYSGRPLPAHLRHSSVSNSLSSTSQSAALQARIDEKKAELQSYKEMRDLSAQLAEKMEALEEKLSTLADGSEAVAAVLANWHSVLSAINMASSKLPKPKDSNSDAEAPESDIPLPQTLVRIPVQQGTRGTADVKIRGE